MGIGYLVVSIYCNAYATKYANSTFNSHRNPDEKEHNTPRLARVVHSPEWLNIGIDSLTSRFAKPYPQRHRQKLTTNLTANHYKPEPPEADERWTDRFHLRHILEPAAVIAASMLEEDVKTGFAPSQNDTVGDLMVTFTSESRCAFTAESKRGLVFMAHLAAFLALADVLCFPWPNRNAQPTEAVKMWIQIWAQMVEYDTLYAKLFSPLGTVYIYRTPGTSILQHSRVYYNMDDEVLRSTALILLAHKQPAAPLVTRVLGAIVGQPVVQSIFSWFMEAVIRVTLIAGTVYGSRGIGAQTSNGYTVFHPVGNETIFLAFFSILLGSVFTDEEKARKETAVLKLCLDHPELHAPEFRGLYSSSHSFGIVMSYAGTAIKDIFSAPEAQKAQLVSMFKMLHGNGIHHHDVRNENVMVNHHGVLTLVDFDRAVILDGKCSSYCPDLETIVVLEKSMGNAQGYEACYL
ncbi:hypothetical protein DFH07DRAFT_1008735 [Mycena maculata]|uniref:Non-specific serine/threonine protein kinase n=1 Tax=Mycena maculata TaxID=230809 RepID=A0AAD7NNF7_9AGAR|nr:hypothetical protein DFH07DRAFT_1008735 [Mycena maculata]